jgi:diphosphomevalonate decarboxylase
MTREQKFLNQSAKLGSLPAGASARTAWSCPSNIALIKYWGKMPGQIPANPSLSFSLRQSRTHMHVECQPIASSNGPILEYYFEGGSNARFGERFGKYLRDTTRFLPFLSHLKLMIRSENTFPHSSGIASSASAFGALALCLVSLEQTLYGTPDNEPEFLEKASFLARLGSGSACRSVYGGFAEWGAAGHVVGASDEVAVPVNESIHPRFRSFADTILIIRSGEKMVSSSQGHMLMDSHPFRQARISQAKRNLSEMMHALALGDEKTLITLVEEEALTLHALMMTSQPGYLLMKPQTIEVIDRIQKFRAETGIPAGFTLDAGANVHILFPAEHGGPVRTFLLQHLAQFTEKGRMIHDETGDGPVILPA